MSSEIRWRILLFHHIDHLDILTGEFFIGSEGDVGAINPDLISRTRSEMTGRAGSLEVVRIEIGELLLEFFISFGFVSHPVLPLWLLNRK